RPLQPDFALRLNNGLERHNENRLEFFFEAIEAEDCGVSMFMFYPTPVREALAREEGPRQCAAHDATARRWPRTRQPQAGIDRPRARAGARRRGLFPRQRSAQERQPRGLPDVRPPQLRADRSAFQPIASEYRASVGTRSREIEASVL